MNNTKLIAYLIIPLPVEIEYGSSKDNDKSYSDLLSLPITLQFNLDEYGIFDTVIESVSRYSDDYNLIKNRFEPSSGRKETILKVSIVNPVPINDTFDRKEPFSNATLSFKGETAINLHKSRISNIFIQQINNFIILINIADPGSMIVKCGFIFQDGEFIKKTNEMFSIIEEACYYCDERKWPKFYKFPIENVWKWANSQKDFNKGYSESQIGRALNAFSNLFGDRINGDHDLFWAMLGIESLYLNGEKSEITSKLNLRIQLFLGEIQIHKKTIKKMYNFRSNFVHGSQNIKRSYYTIESEKSIKSDIEHYHITQIALGILIATFQELVKKNWYKLSFSTVIDDPEIKPT